MRFGHEWHFHALWPKFPSALARECWQWRLRSWGNKRGGLQKRDDQHAWICRARGERQILSLIFFLSLARAKPTRLIQLVYIGELIATITLTLLVFRVGSFPYGVRLEHSEIMKPRFMNYASCVFSLIILTLAVSEDGYLSEFIMMRIFLYCILDAYEPHPTYAATNGETCRKDTKITYNTEWPSRVYTQHSAISTFLYWTILSRKLDTIGRWMRWHWKWFDVSYEVFERRIRGSQSSLLMEDCMRTDNGPCRAAGTRLRLILKYRRRPDTQVRKGAISCTCARSTKQK